MNESHLHLENIINNIYIYILNIKKFFFLKFFNNSEFDFLKMDIKKCPKSKNENENYKNFSKKSLVTIMITKQFLLIIKCEHNFFYEILIFKIKII